MSSLLSYYKVIHSVIAVLARMANHEKAYGSEKFTVRILAGGTVIQHIMKSTLQATKYGIILAHLVGIHSTSTSTTAADYRLK